VDDLPASAEQVVRDSFRGSLGDSFVVVPRSDPDEFVERPAQARTDGAPLSVASLEKVTRIERIMSLASGQTDQDHPVCADCLRLTVAEVQRQVDQAADEHRAYQEAHGRLREELEAFSAEEAAQLEADIAELEAEEERLTAELAGHCREEAQLREELERQRRQEEQLQRGEEEFWLSAAEYELDAEEGEEERAVTQSAIQYATSELHRLKRTNVLNDMFFIKDEGQFGTISRFRLGRLPDHPVQWEEINAAWGQACLLLDALVKMSGTCLQQYRLKPNGSYSSIQAGGDVLGLYSGDGGLTSFFLDRRFDQAMAAFLKCLHQVAKTLAPHKIDQLPYKIDGDKVGGFSVRQQFNQDEKWTKALKFMLTDLKWLIPCAQARDLADRGVAVGQSS